MSFKILFDFYVLFLVNNLRIHLTRIASSYYFSIIDSGFTSDLWSIQC